MIRRNFLTRSAQALSMLFSPGGAATSRLGAAAGELATPTALSTTRAFLSHYPVIKALYIASDSRNGLQSQVMLDTAVFNLAHSLREDQKQGGRLSGLLRTLVRGLAGSDEDSAAREAKLVLMSSEPYQAALREVATMTEASPRLIRQWVEEIAHGYFGGRDVSNPEFISPRTGSYDPFDFLFRDDGAPLLTPQQLVADLIKGMIHREHATIQLVFSKQGDAATAAERLVQRIAEMDVRGPFGGPGPIPKIAVRLPSTEGEPVRIEVHHTRGISTYDGKGWSTVVDPSLPKKSPAPRPGSRFRRRMEAAPDSKTPDAPAPERVWVNRKQWDGLNTEVATLRQEKAALQLENDWLEWAQGNDVN